MLLDPLAMRARLSPAQPALWAEGHWYSYAELDARATALAAALATAGVRAGDRVALLAENSLSHFDLMHAAPRLGHIPVLCNYRLPLAEQAPLLDSIAPKLLLHDASQARAAAELGRPSWGPEELEARCRGVAGAPSAPTLGPEDTALILFTGGSTGRPKGACISYRQQFYNQINTIVGWGLRPEDAVIQATPCFHAAVNALATPLLHLGGRVILQRRFEPEGYLELLGEQGATLMFLVPTMYQMLSEAGGFAGADFSALRWAISGGAPCPAPLRERFAARGVAFRQGYGMTEAGVNCFAISSEEARLRPASVGRPMPYAQAVVRDPRGRPLPDGEVGELTLAGPHLFSGYWRQPEASAEMLREGWLWTGDYARRDSQGFFSICGRRKEMYISGGENVYPAEVEALLYAQPEIAECAVLGVPNPRWGEVGLAVLVAAPGARIDLDRLRARLRDELAGYKRPCHYRIVDALPKTGAGKIDKPALRRRYANEGVSA